MLFYKGFVYIFKFPIVFKLSIIVRIITKVYVMPQLMQHCIVLNQLPPTHSIGLSCFPASVSSFVYVDDTWQHTIHACLKIGTYPMVLCNLSQISLTQFRQYFNTMSECNPCSLFCLFSDIFIADDTCPLLSYSVKLFFLFAKA